MFSTYIFSPWHAMMVIIRIMINIIANTLSIDIDMPRLYLKSCNLHLHHHQKAGWISCNMIIQVIIIENRQFNNHYHHWPLSAPNGLACNQWQCNAMIIHLLGNHQYGAIVITTAADDEKNSITLHYIKIIIPRVGAIKVNCTHTTRCCCIATQPSEL